MEKRNCIRVQALLPESKAMLAEGKMQREAAEYYGFQDKYVVKKRLVERRTHKNRAAFGSLVFRSAETARLPL